MELSVRRTSNVRLLILQTRTSPVSRPASIAALALAIAAIVIPLSTNLTFAEIPNLAPLILCTLGLDIVSQFAPQTHRVEAVQVTLYGILYIAIICVCALIAGYGAQRLAMPLQDEFFARLDAALGFDWLTFVQWVDQYPLRHAMLYVAYQSMGPQIAVTIMVLAFGGYLRDLRIFLVAFALTLTTTIAVAALLPAAGPIAAVDTDAFQILQFTGATPADHLRQLQQPEPLRLTSPPAGIATFPSFHAAIAVLIPVTLHRYRALDAVFIIVNGLMLTSALTEGAHYLCDLLAGGTLAIATYALATRLIAAEQSTISINAGTTASAVV